MKIHCNLENRQTYVIPPTAIGRLEVVWLILLRGLHAVSADLGLLCAAVEGGQIYREVGAVLRGPGGLRCRVINMSRTYLSSFS